MQRCLFQPRDMVSLLVAAFLCACAGHSTTALLPSAAAPSLLAPMAVPPQCAGEKAGPKYGSATAIVSTRGGSFCVPAFGGFGGDILYPDANRSVKVGLISSTSNYNHGLPSLGRGTPVFYLQLSFSSVTTFGTSLPAGGGLAGKKLIPGKTYTAFGQGRAGLLFFRFKPCFLNAAKSNYGGIISDLGTLLKAKTIPGKATIVIEIYPGRQTGAKC
jgi:hypothetical protein